MRPRSGGGKVVGGRVDVLVEVEVVEVVLVVVAGGSVVVVVVVEVVVVAAAEPAPFDSR